MNKLTLSLFFALFSFQVFAADLAGISKIFKKTFWTDHYQDRYCGSNIENLLAKAIEARLDLSGAEILRITDEGGWMFGMVNAVQAREGGNRILPERLAPRNLPGEENWNFHVVLLVNGRVMDYDFTNDAKVVPLNKYLLDMFIPAGQQTSTKYKQDKMKFYKIKSYPAEDYMLRLNQRLPYPVAKEAYLKDYLPSFF